MALSESDTRFGPLKRDDSQQICRESSGVLMSDWEFKFDLINSNCCTERIEQAKWVYCLKEHWASIRLGNACVGHVNSTICRKNGFSTMTIKRKRNIPGNSHLSSVKQGAVFDEGKFVSQNWWSTATRSDKFLFGIPGEAAPTDRLLFGVPKTEWTDRREIRHVEL